MDYGADFRYGSHTPDDINLRTDHTVHLSGLTGGKTYHYRIRTRDAQGRESIGPDRTFRAPEEPVAASNDLLKIDLHPKASSADASLRSSGYRAATAYSLPAAAVLLFLAARLLRRRKSR